MDRARGWEPPSLQRAQRLLAEQGVCVVPRAIAPGVCETMAAAALDSVGRARATYSMSWGGTLKR